MSPATAVATPTAATKGKKATPTNIHTNGVVSSTSSPSPSISNKKVSSGTKPAPNSAGDRNITVSTVRPVNRGRRDTSSGAAGRHSRNSAGLRTGDTSGNMTGQDDGPPPYSKFDLLPSGLCLNLLTLIFLAQLLPTHIY